MRANAGARWPDCHLSAQPCPIMHSVPIQQLRETDEPLVNDVRHISVRLISCDGRAMRDIKTTLKCVFQSVLILKHTDDHSKPLSARAVSTDLDFYFSQVQSHGQK